MKDKVSVSWILDPMTHRLRESREISSRVEANTMAMKNVIEENIFGVTREISHKHNIFLESLWAHGTTGIRWIETQFLNRIEKFQNILMIFRGLGGIPGNLGGIFG